MGKINSTYDFLPCPMHMRLRACHYFRLSFQSDAIEILPPLAALESNYETASIPHLDNLEVISRDRTRKKDDAVLVFILLQS